jgi:hypothetical protein
MDLVRVVTANGVDELIGVTACRRDVPHGLVARETF